MMKAITVAEFGGPEKLQASEIPMPRPGPGEALVKLEYAGINFIDIYMRSGRYVRSHTYQTPLPMTLGMEGGGTVTEVGEGTTGITVGDRVAYCLVRGSYAEYAVVPAWRLVNVPEGISIRKATSMLLQGLTAHYLCSSAFPLGPEHTCLVHAGAGGVGRLLIQLAKLRGAAVITTVGSREKADIARECGADHVIMYRESDFRESVMKVTGGRGVDVVYDAVGKDTIARSIRSLRRRGVCINYGGASGLVESIEPLELAEAGSIFFTRPHLADYTATPEELRGRAAEIFAAEREGALRVAIDQEFALLEAAHAHRYIEGKNTTGKLLLGI